MADTEIEVSYTGEFDANKRSGVNFASGHRLWGSHLPSSHPLIFYIE
jgi:hypothetical protein